jgi:spermidine synthase
MRSSEHVASKRPFLFSDLSFFSLIFATGASGLVYQVVWHRYLSRLLGSDTFATSIILGVFLGGLAFGYRLLGDLSAGVKKHFKIYALLEAFIGIWGLIFALLFGLVHEFTTHWSFNPPFLLVFQGIFLTVLLVGPPTICMGGTVPILTRGFSSSLEDATGVHAKIYAINTLGAFVGALAAGFWLIQELGLPGTVRLAAIVNLLAAAFFACYPIKSLSHPARPQAARATAGQKQGAPSSAAKSFSPGALYLIAFCSGLSVMTLENVLIRIVNLSMGASAYSFSMIVGAFILAIALGSLAVSRMRNLTRNALFINQTAVVILLIALYSTLDVWPQLAHVSKILAEPDITGFWIHHARSMAFLTVVLVLPVGFMGASIPIMFHELKRSFQEVGKHSGRLLAWNTAGNLFGSLAGGILLYYILDNGRVFLAATTVAAMAALLASRPLARIVRIGAAALFLSTLCLAIYRPFYDHSRFMVGTFREREPKPYSFQKPKDFYSGFNAGQELLFYKDGPSGTVSVIETGYKLKDGRRDRTIMVNGKPDSSTVFDIQTLRLSAHIPALLAEERKKILIIGLGTGVTAAEMSLYPEVEELHVAEISSTVIRALRWFSQFTYSLATDPRLKIHHGDAFRVLSRNPGKWDVIISEPSNPWMLGVDQLFTREFYALAENKLEDHGLLLQWMHLYEASEDMLGMVLNTLLGVFPHCRVFVSQPNDLLILASKRPVGQQDVERAGAVLAGNPRVAGSLSEIRLPTLEAVLLREIWNSSAGVEGFKKYGVQTMDHPRLHYLGGRSFFMGKNVDHAFLFNSFTADHPDDFLLAGSPSWPDFPELPENYWTLRASVLGDLFNLPALWPLVSALDLRAGFAVGLEEGGERKSGDSRLDLIRLAMSRADEEAWNKAGLGDKEDQEKVEALMEVVKNSRNWINPYPLEGLKALLERRPGPAS